MYTPAFPCHLEQPSQGFKSSVDALLLAGFALHCLAGKGQSLKFAELGCGTGMAACALALALPEARGCGLDVDAQAVAAARQNAANLALAERLDFVPADVADRRTGRKLCGEELDLVLANPPYHSASRGRRSPLLERSVALHADERTLPHFCAAAFALLRHHGRFCCIHSPARAPELLQCLGKHRLGVRRLLPLHTRPGKDAQWVLVEARKGAALDMRLEKGLTLYAAAQGEEFSPEALAFCPWLHA